MDYTVVSSYTLAELIQRVNDYREIGYRPIGGLTAVRERVSGPVSYFQAVFNSSNTEFPKRGRGRPRGSYKRNDNGTPTQR